MTQNREFKAVCLAILIFVYEAFTIAVAQSDKAVITIGDSTLTLYTQLDEYEIGSQVIIGWVEKSANIVANYYGQFPVSEASVVLDAFNGSSVVSGRAHGQPVLQVVVEIGQYVTQKQLDRDWILVHELIHFALADIPDRHHWLEEGLPTYIESISRVQAGDLDERFVWKGFLKNMPKGMPIGDDLGLDGARSLGRMYWGGALFGLLADIEIHKQTNNKFSLQDALRTVVKSGLTMDKSVTIDELIAVADGYTGTTVLAQLYAQMKDESGDVNLKAIWAELGINYNNDSGLVTLDDSAPLAAIRQSIMTP